MNSQKNKKNKYKVKNIIKKNRINKTKEKFTVSMNSLEYAKKYKKLFLSQLFAVLWSIWSFKLLQNLSIIKVERSKKHKDKMEVKFSKNAFLQHQESKRNYLSYILRSGVCPLGTFGSIMIIFWASLQLFVMKNITKNKINQGINNIKHNIKKKTVSRILSISTFCIMLIYLYLTYIMNYPLFVRTIPWFASQGYISYQLYNYIK